MQRPLVKSRLAQLPVPAPARSRTRPTVAVPIMGCVALYYAQSGRNTHAIAQARAQKLGRSIQQLAQLAYTQQLDTMANLREHRRCSSATLG